MCSLCFWWPRKERPQSVEVQRVLLRRGGANATLLALGTLQSTAAPATTPATNAAQQAPVDALAATQHIDIGIEGEVYGHQDVGNDEELMRLGHTILTQRQRDGNLRGGRRSSVSISSQDCVVALPSVASSRPQRRC